MPMPPDLPAEAQADAFACLTDALNLPTAAVAGGSVGAHSALQMAIRHPDRISALIQPVSLGNNPPGAANFAGRCGSGPRRRG